MKRTRIVTIFALALAATLALPTLGSARPRHRGKKALSRLVAKMKKRIRTRRARVARLKRLLRARAPRLKRTHRHVMRAIVRSILRGNARSARAHVLKLANRIRNKRARAAFTRMLMRHALRRAIVARFASKRPGARRGRAIKLPGPGKLSRAKLTRVIKNLERTQETVRNKRQMAQTAFQNFDQKSNQLYNLLSRIMKTMNEMRMGTVRNML